MRREHVSRIIAKRADTPGAANDLLEKVRILIHFAIDNGWCTDDPTLRLKKFAAGEFHTWTYNEIATFEARRPKGSCERTAFALQLCTGQRHSDAVRIAWDDVENGTIRVVQGKTSAAGLPDRCVTHGLRKAAARRLAETGCTVNEIAAITGHSTLVEVSRYTKAADQVHLAQTAIDRMTARQSAQRVPTPSSGSGKIPKNQINSNVICSQLAHPAGARLT